MSIQGLQSVHMSVRLFCSLCGNKLTEQKDGTFEEETGHPIMIKICLNIKCESGCFNKNGHSYIFLRRNCNFCGHDRGHVLSWFAGIC